LNFELGTEDWQAQFCLQATLQLFHLQFVKVANGLHGLVATPSKAETIRPFNLTASSHVSL
jgi:hypothetical protein